MSGQAIGMHEEEEPEIPYVGMTQEQASRRIGGIPALPKLTGAKTEWVAFLISYRESTKEYGLSNSENMYRLQACLEGDARILLRGCLLFPHQVPEAIKRLEMFYGTPEKLLGEAEDALFQLPPLERDLSNLGLYSGEVTYTVAVIELSKESTRNLTLMRLIERKFPPSFGMSWAKRKTATSTLVTMKQFLDEQLMYAMVANVDVMKVSRAPPVKKKPVLTVTEQPAAQPTQPRPQSLERACSFGCEEQHDWQGCPVFLRMTPTERKGKCNQMRHCYRCLLKHQFGRCRGKRCAVTGCGATHHALLHVPRNEFVGHTI